MTTSKQQIVILGGGYAGLLAAARLGGDPKLDVTLVDARPEFLQRIRFHEMLAGGSPSTLPYAPLLARRNVRFIQGRIEELDPKAQRISGRDAANQPFAMGYDSAIVALGSATPAGVAGADRNTLRLNDPADIRAAHARLAELATRAGRVLVVGAGLTGIETATELAERLPGLRVTLATNGELGQGYAAGARQHLRQVCARLRIEVRERLRIVAVDEHEALVEGEAPLPFDLCIWTAGFQAAPLARQAGLEVDSQGRALVDGNLRAIGHPNVVVAGDSAAGQPALRMSCAAAMPMGAYAAEAARSGLRGTPLAPFSLGFAGHCISLGRREALLHFVGRDDIPVDKFWTGRRAVWAKELICRSTTWVLNTELKTGWKFYRWLPAGAAAARGTNVTYEV